MTGTRGCGRRTAYGSVAALVALLTVLPVGAAAADIGPSGAGRGGLVLIFPPGPEQAQQPGTPYRKQSVQQQPDPGQNPRQNRRQNTDTDQNGDQNAERKSDAGQNADADQNADQNAAQPQAPVAGLMD